MNQAYALIWLAILKILKIRNSNQLNLLIKIIILIIS